MIGGTFGDSKIRKARKEFECITPGHTIKPGELYLRYHWGMYDSSAICLECATTSRRDSGSLRYDCVSLRKHMGIDILEA